MCMSIDPEDNTTENNNGAASIVDRAVVEGLRDPYESFARSLMGLQPFSDNDTCPGDDEEDEEVKITVEVFQIAFL